MFVQTEKTNSLKDKLLMDLRIIGEIQSTDYLINVLRAEDLVTSFRP